MKNISTLTNLKSKHFLKKAEAKPTRKKAEYQRYDAQNKSSEARPNDGDAKRRSCAAPSAALARGGLRHFVPPTRLRLVILVWLRRFAPPTRLRLVSAVWLRRYAPPTRPCLVSLVSRPGGPFDGAAGPQGRGIFSLIV